MRKVCIILFIIVSIALLASSAWAKIHHEATSKTNKALTIILPVSLSFAGDHANDYPLSSVVYQDRNDIQIGL